MTADTDPKLRPLTFEIDGEDRQKIVRWMQDHGCRALPDSFGGLLSYHFTPCGIGMSTWVTCPCGGKLDLTDVSTW